MLIAVRIISAIALLGSVYLAFVSLRATGIAGCDGGLLDCDHVLNSKWSKWVGIPVAMFGTVVYAGILAFSWSLKLPWQKLCFFALCIVAGMSAIWFSALQVFALDAICPFCMIVHACGLLIFLISLGINAVSSRRKHHVSYRWPLGAGALALGVLITGQIMYQPDEFRVEEFASVGPSDGEDPAEPVDLQNEVTLTENSPLSDSSEKPTEPATEQRDGSVELENDPLEQETSVRDESAVAPPDVVKDERSTGDAAGTDEKANDPTMPEEDSEADPNPGVVATEEAPTSDPPASSRRVPILGGVVFLSLADYPVSGELDAEHVVVKMFDYTCKNCRILHQQLDRYRDRESRVAFLLLVVPLNADCNPHVRSTNPKHQKACDYARLSLALWNARPEKFIEFHNWMMEGDQAPPLEQAIERAAELAEDPEIKKQMFASAVGKSLRENANLYRQCRAGSVPKLIFRTKILSGGGSKEERLFAAIDQILFPDN